MNRLSLKQKLSSDKDNKKTSILSFQCVFHSLTHDSAQSAGIQCLVKSPVTDNIAMILPKMFRNQLRTMSEKEQQSYHQELFVWHISNPLLALLQIMRLVSLTYLNYNRDKMLKKTQLHTCIMRTF